VAAIILGMLMRRKSRTGGEDEDEDEAEAFVETESYVDADLYVTQEGLSHDSDATENDETDGAFLEVTEES
jgi:hypothetical protein